MSLLWPAAGYAKWVLRPFVLTIPKGPLTNSKWIVASGLKFFFGSFEQEKTQAIERTLLKGQVAYDIGAHVGYYSILMSYLTGSEGQVVSFEPRPLNLAYLQKHISLNGCANVTVIEACVGDRTGQCRFDERCNTSAGHISDSGRLVVSIVSLDELYSEGEIKLPDFVKVDVEGSELAVLKGMQNMVTNSSPTILLATHSEELDRDCCAFLAEFGYELTEVMPFVPGGDREVLAVHTSRKSTA